VDTNLLRSFLAVTRTGSFSAAARQLGYTQSAVSQHIAALESDLGAALLHRRPVGLTEAGQRLAEHAGPILMRLDAARADIRRSAGEAAANVHLGATPLAHPFAHPWWLARAVTGQQAAMPRVRFTLRIAGRDAVATAVAAGELDLGLVDGLTAPSDPLTLPDTGPLTVATLDEQPVSVVLPAHHPLSTWTHARLDHLADAVWLDAPDIATPLPRLRAMARTDGFHAGLRYEGTDVRTLLSLVAAGAGLTVLPAQALDQRPGLVGVPLAEPRLVHRVDLVHAGVSGPASAVVASLGAAAAV
jgi:DNA-binding transcriptional LysR family regulator